MNSRYYQANDYKHDFKVAIILTQLSVLHPRRSGCSAKSALAYLMTFGSAKVEPILSVYTLSRSNMFEPILLVLN